MNIGPDLPVLSGKGVQGHPCFYERSLDCKRTFCALSGYPFARKVLPYTELDHWSTSMGTGYTRDAEHVPPEFAGLKIPPVRGDGV